MDTQGAIQIATIVLLVLGIVAVLAIIVTILQVRRLARRAESSLDQMQGDLTATLRQTRSTLERVEQAVQGVDVVVREQITPSIDSARWTLAKAQRSVLKFTEGASKVQRVAQAVQAVSGAGVVAALSRQVLRRGGGIGLVALAAGAVVQALLRRNSSNKHVRAAKDELPSAISERSQPKDKNGHGIKVNGR
jgi:uncharacterized protein YoxC